MLLPFMHSEDTAIPKELDGEMATIPGPQRRGTGGTLIVVWENDQDRCHRPCSAAHQSLKSMRIGECAEVRDEVRAAPDRLVLCGSGAPGADGITRGRQPS